MTLFLIRTSLAVGLAITAAAVPQQGANAQSIAPGIELPAALQAQLKPFLSNSPPSALLNSVQMSTLGSRNDSKAIPTVWHYERLESGLWGISTWITSSDKAILKQYVSLQGLVNVVLLNEFDFNTKSPVAPIDKAFKPFGINNVLRATLWAAASELRGDLAAITTLPPGGGFSYSTVMDGWNKVRQGNNTETKATHAETSTTCTAGSAMDGKALHAAVRGPYLLVSCQTTNARKQIMAIDQAYLVDSALFVPLRSAYREGYGAYNDYSETATITAVEYAP